MNPPQRGNARGRGRWTSFNYRRTSTGHQRPKPISIPVTHPSSDNHSEASSSYVSSGNDQSQPFVVRHIGVTGIEQYPGWNMYFPEESFAEGSNIVGKLKAFEKHIFSHPTLYELEETKTRLWYPLTVSTVTRDEDFMRSWPMFEQDLHETPEETLKCVGLAMHQRLISLPNVPCSQNDGSSSKDFNLQQVHARIQTNLKPVGLNLVRVDRNEKLIVVRGNVVRVGSLEHRATWIAYRCTRCNAEQAIKQTKQSETVPRSCPCRNRSPKNFVALVSSPFTSIEACQTIHLQEILLTDRTGRVPRTIKIELFQDLVDSVYPGDDVTVHAIVQCPPQDEQHKSGVSPMRAMHLKAVSISSNRNVSITWKSSFSESDYAAVQSIKSNASPFRLLVHSLAPMIYGHEIVKAGLLLALLGGSDNANRRSQCHVLIVGDPGLGKSQMLQACADASPKGIFVCGGKTSSTAGLTVSIHHEKGNNTSLAAGPLLLVDQGTCCVDELDKMSNSNQALLEVMEQQCVSIAKAGVFCSLPARTSVIAAANPTGGHYNKSRTVSENVRMNPALLSRFDLVFVILDRPNAELDSRLYEHTKTLRNMPQVLIPSNSVGGFQSTYNDENSEPLNVRLKLRRNEKINPLTREDMQIYIAFARKYCHPKLSEDAIKLLRDFFLELRSAQQGNNSIPVTTRQLEAMIRLTQARARAEMCDLATGEHANDVITIVRHSMIDVLSTDEGTIQLQRNVNGSGMSQTGQIRQFVRLLQVKTSQSNKSIFSSSELKEMAESANLRFLSFADTLETMNIQGFLLKKGTNLYKFLKD